MLQQGVTSEFGVNMLTCEASSADSAWTTLASSLVTLSEACGCLASTPSLHAILYAVRWIEELRNEGGTLEGIRSRSAHTGRARRRKAAAAPCQPKHFQTAIMCKP